MKLADNLYAFPWSQMTVNNCNTFFLSGSTPMMVDPGHAQVFGHVEMGLKSDGIESGPALVVMTHCHPDHLEAAIGLQQGGARLAMHQDEIQYMEGEGRAMAAAMGMSFPDIQFEVILTEGELQVGEHTLQVIHTPGHSPGHICLYHPETKALFAGDLIFAQGVGRVDFPGGSGEDLKKSIERVSQLDLEYVLTGHGPILKGAESIKRNFELIRNMYFGMI